MVQWPLSWALVHTQTKKLVPVVIAVAVWGKQWPRQSVMVCSDNMVVVAAFKVGFCQDVTMMHPMHCLHFFSAYHKLRILLDQVSGKDNLAADALLHNNNSAFFSVAPVSGSPLVHSTSTAGHAVPQLSGLDLTQLRG